MPEKRSAATVKSAVQSINVGSKNSPVGTAKSKKPSGNASAFAIRKPMIVTTAACNMNASANCSTTCALAAEATSHNPPAAKTNRTPHHQGRAVIAASSLRLRHASHRQIGTTTKPCANVADRVQIATID